MQIFLYITLPAMAYLLGSFSSAVWFGNWFKGIDLRNFGSKNAGATNAFRVLGASVAIPVFVTDTAKGFLAVIMARLLNFETNNEWFWVWSVILGACSVIGHIFPVFTGFKGGKGVACMLGVLLALQPVAAVCCLGIFLFVFLIFRIVSVGSITAALSYPIFNILIFGTDSMTMQFFSVIAAISIIAMHYKNIGRLFNGTEKKLEILRKYRNDNP